MKFGIHIKHAYISYLYLSNFTDTEHLTLKIGDLQEVIVHLLEIPLLLGYLRSKRWLLGLVLNLSEYRSLANLVAKLAWIESLMKETGFPLLQSTVIWCDNINATSHAANPVFHACTKHIVLCALCKRQSFGQTTCSALEWRFDTCIQRLSVYLFLYGLLNPKFNYPYLNIFLVFFLKKYWNLDR